MPAGCIKGYIEHALAGAMPWGVFLAYNFLTGLLVGSCAFLAFQLDIIVVLQWAPSWSGLFLPHIWHGLLLGALWASVFSWDSV